MTAEMLMEDCERKDRIRKRGFMILHTLICGSDDEPAVREVYVDYCNITMIAPRYDADGRECSTVTMFDTKVYTEETVEEVFCERDAASRAQEEIWEKRSNPG